MKRSLIPLAVVLFCSSAFAQADLKPLNADLLILDANIKATMAQYETVLGLLNEQTMAAKSPKTTKEQLARLSDSISTLIEEKKVDEAKIKGLVNDYNAALKKLAEDNG